MNLIFRLLWVWLVSLRRERLPVEGAESRLKLIVLPNDLDLNMHVNNGRFLTLADLSRVDLFIRTGLLGLMRSERWTPIVTEHTMVYKKPLKLFQKFEAVMQLTHWDERHFYMRHQFMIEDRVMAEGTSKGVLRGKQGVVAPAMVIERLHALRGTQMNPSGP
jgi:acyl-CoA thioesterase FadM